MASLQELTAQVVALTAEVQGLTGRLVIAEQAAAGAQQMQGGNGGNGGGAGVFDKTCLYPKDLKDTTSFRAWAERFIAWLSMDNEEIGKAFVRAAKQEKTLDLSGLTALQVAYSKAVYNRLAGLTENYKKDARIVRLVKGQNGLEAWRRLSRRFDPQNPAVHAADLEAIITFGSKNAVTPPTSRQS